MIKEIGGGIGYLDYADDANVPVDIWLQPLEELIEDYEEWKEYYEEGYRWILRVGNYLPRKGTVVESAWQIISDNRKELEEQLEKYVIPLYETALNKIKKIVSGEESHLYYWG